MRHPLVAIFAPDEWSGALVKLNDRGLSEVRGRGKTKREAVLDFSARLENLAAELRALAEAA